MTTAHYLTTRHGITNVAVLETGWIGSGNTARYTMTVRSNYLLSPRFELKNFALQLWKSLSQYFYGPEGGCMRSITE